MPDNNEPNEPNEPNEHIDPDLTTGSVETDRSRLPGFPGAYGGSGIPTHPALPTRPYMPAGRGDSDHGDSEHGVSDRGEATPGAPTTGSADLDSTAPETGAYSTINLPGSAAHPATDKSVVIAPSEPYFAFPEQDSVPAAPETPMLRPRPERIRSAAIVGVRVISGGIGVAVAAAVVAAVALLPIPTITANAPSVTVTPTATAQQLVCPGAVLSLSDDTGRAATTASAIGSPLITSTATRGDVAEAALTETDADSGGSDAAPQVLSDTAVDGQEGDEATEPGLLSGVQSQSLTEGDTVGLAAASCSVASGDTWLVGGANTTGRTTLITLSNPSEVASIVDLEVFSEEGVVTAPGLTGIAVEAGGQRVLSLSGFAPQAVSPVVHVSSRGGLVVANLQQSIVRGIVSGGVDIVGGGQAPSETNIIPGVVVRNAGAVGARASDTDYNDLQPVLRMYVAGDASAAVRVDVKPEDTTGNGASFTLDVEGGMVTDLPLDGLDDGKYTVTVESDAPAVAGVRVSTMGGADVDERTDFAWFASASELTSDTLVSVPRGVDPALHLVNTTAADIEVVITALSGPRAGDEATANIGAGSSFIASVDSGANYSLTGFDSLYASVSAQTDGGVAGFTVVPPAASTTPVRIYP